MSKARKKRKSAKSSKGAVQAYGYRTQPNAYSMDPTVRFYRRIGVRSL